MEPWAQRLTELAKFEPAERCGTVIGLSSDYVSADGPDLPLGSRCMIDGEGARGQARIIAVDRTRVVLAPLDPLNGIRLGDRVRGLPDDRACTVGQGFAGRAVDALGRPIDDGPDIRGHGQPVGRTSPLERTTETRPLFTGVTAIDLFMPLVRGQRMGIFAAPGVGKTRLLTRLVGHADADRCIICLVGERGREVEALWDHVRRSENLARTTLVVATSDDTAAARCQAIDQALALAAFWRDRGEHVLLLLDSATRYAMALREIGLAAGEPPTVRAYTPNVFAALPRMVERCGAIKGGGAITAIMTVLSETDDLDDPVCELMKSLLDGHILLTRDIAARGRFPAIDVPRSLSRLADRAMSSRQARLTARARAALGIHESVRTMIEAGVYVAGSNTATDQAIHQHAQLEILLNQTETGGIPANARALDAALGELERIMAS